MKTYDLHATPWWLMHVHNACYTLMGIVLLLHPAKSSFLHAALLGGLLAGAGVCTLLLGWQRRQAGQFDSYWFILSSLRDIIFGTLILLQMQQPRQALIDGLGFWALVYAFLQAIEANFYFLGTRSNGDKDYWVEVIHFICVFIAGGFAFLLLMRPGGAQASLPYVGLFLVALGLVQIVLTQRLRRDAARHSNL